MRKLLNLFVLTLLFFTACKKEKSDITNNGNETDTLKGIIEADRTLDASKSYFLKGQVFVKNNAVLTIPAGITVMVEKNESAENKSVLVITKGSKLNINGTADKPVVFTSAAITKSPGDWGAVILLGNAPTNVGVGNVTGLASSTDTQYGGTNADDNSGSISFLRIEYSGGINAPQEDEWAVDKASGLSLNGVGSGTKINNVIVAHSNDDGFQFLGGTVNATNLIGYNNGDDDFDFDLGYEGNLQFLISYRTQASSQALRANGMESYNDEVPTSNLPFTRPVISNMTIIGPQGVETNKSNLNQAVYIRKGTRFAVRNSVIAEYPQGGLMVCNKTRPVLLNNTGSEFKYNLVQTDIADRAFSWDKDVKVVADPELTTFATNAVNNNKVIIASADLKLKTLYGSVPDLTPMEGATALTGANFDGLDFSNSFFNKVSYRGAVGNANWAATSNWANWK